VAHILIGIVLALAFSFALPLYAVYSWRYNLADGLRGCAQIHKRIVRGDSITADEHLKLMRKLNAIMLQLRSLMPSVSKEVKISITELETIQGHFRLCLSTLELLGNLRPAGSDALAMNQLQSSLAAENRQVSRQLLGMARALKGGTTQRLSRNLETPDSEPVTSHALAGYQLLTLELRKNVDALQRKLAKTSTQWNI
jgi:uncharacterized membrane protein YccC